jgi:3-keto-L-gulonate-6-phosphate decarboxylase
MMRIETVTRKGKEFAVIPVEDLQKLMEDAEMLADVKAYDAARLKRVYKLARTNSSHWKSASAG